MIKEELKPLYRRIFAISYKLGLSHVGSCVTALPIIDEIYRIKKPDEKFVLSAAHSSLALYVVLEYNGGRNAEEIFKHHGVHCDRCKECGLDFSGGSLGHGLAASCGMALANRNKNVHILVSDGEIAEGICDEALRFARDNNLRNLKVHVNFNGWGAMRRIYDVSDQLIGSGDYGRYDPVEINIHETNTKKFPILKGQEAHYKVLNEEEYKEMLNML